MPQQAFQERDPQIIDGVKTYTIMAGDNLTRFASRNNTTIEEIMKANPHIKDKNKIYKGETIAMPGKWTDLTTPLDESIIDESIIDESINTNLNENILEEGVLNLENTNVLPPSATQSSWNKLKEEQKDIRRRGWENTKNWFRPGNFDQTQQAIRDRQATKIDRITNRWDRRAARKDMLGQIRGQKQESRQLIRDLRKMNPQRLQRLDAQNIRKQEKFGEGQWEGNWGDLSRQEKQKIRQDQRQVNRFTRQGQKDINQAERQENWANTKQKIGNWLDPKVDKFGNLKPKRGLGTGVGGDIFGGTSVGPEAPSINPEFNPNLPLIMGTEGLRTGGPTRYQDEGPISPDLTGPGSGTFNFNPNALPGLSRDTIWNPNMMYTSNPPKFEYTTTDPGSGQISEGKAPNTPIWNAWRGLPYEEGNWSSEQGGNIPMNKLIDMYMRNKQLDVAPGGEYKQEFRKTGGPIKYESYGTNVLPEGWQPTGNIAYTEGTEDIVNAANRASMNTANISQSELGQIEDPNTAGMQGAEIGSTIMQTAQAYPEQFAKLGQFGKSLVPNWLKPTRWLAQDLASTGADVASTGTDVLTSGADVGKDLLLGSESLATDAISGVGGTAAEGAGTAASAGAGSWIPYSLLGNLAGRGISALSDDEDPTTMNFGESFGTGLSGAATGAGIGSMIMPGIGTALGAIGGGLWSLLSGKNKRDEARTRVEDIYNKYVRPNIGVQAQAQQLGKTYYGSDMGKRLKSQLGGIPYKMRAYA